ncbi:DUF72 domain-containing protein [uncultured Sphingomonas sp.]|uniref:DUF72 domain-containing protein n=1 Tax=uncultured Sphingomonas sp. TaxID=158754 RepID=UPI0025EC2A7B|nr:DUF72 domain-containing protein [uncultured Sphingomonas sp.]
MTTTIDEVPVQVRIGTAGWSIGAEASPSFPGSGSNLERYAGVLPAAEINSSFHRSHRPASWARWRDSVPQGFRFSVKMPKTISHERKLVDCTELVSDFLAQVETLGDKLAILLLQLPPKLAFDRDVAGNFLRNLRRRTTVTVAAEPRHASWFEKEPDGLLNDLGVARVAADPAIRPEAAVPAGWRGLEYWRLHGSPIKYRSSYSDRLQAYAEELRRAEGRAVERWCIFDNTASSAAISDALRLHAMLER